MQTGTIKRIIGPVVDVDFGNQEESIPDIYTALEVKKDDPSNSGGRVYCGYSK